ncbi:unnamed protein product [Rhizopus stolonifer]
MLSMSYKLFTKRLPCRFYTTNKRVLAIPTKMKEMKLQCTEFDQYGTVYNKSGEFVKLDFCQYHSLLSRDLRNIDTYSIYQKPTILVRPEAILVSIAHWKALLKWDTVVLFDVFGSINSYNQSLFICDLQERLNSSKESLPFEFRDSVDIEEFVNGEKLRDLLKFSKKLAKFEQDVLSIRDALEEVLDNDEDLVALYLTDKKRGKQRACQDHEEAELLLEAYFKQTEEIAAKASTLRRHMRSTEDIMQLMLDVSRNSLMWYDIRLTIFTLSASVVSGLGALLGMNLRNYFEHDPYAFGIVSGFALLSGAGAFTIALRKLRALAKFSQKSIY